MSPTSYKQRQAALIRDRKIDLVLDVGANRGQFATALRDELGYRGRIVSFEPLKDVFPLLQQAAAQDPLGPATTSRWGTATVPR